MENNNNFSLKDVIFNLLFIILFVFILLWLFPSKSFLNKNGLYNSDKTQTNQVFNHNIATMKEAAISYFTTSRLPKKVGDTVKMSLSQMIDKKLLLSLIDSKGNVCEESLSYIEITKEDDEYILKVSLSCSDNEDYILVHLGCYDYCDGDVCERREPEQILYKYQYKLEIPCKLTDWSNWSDWSYNYIAANANRRVETKVETETINSSVRKYCPAGYLYSAYTNKCYKSSNSTEIKDAIKNVSYECEAGYVLDKTDNKCKKEVTTTTSIAARENPVSYNCNNYPGYTLEGDKCVKTISTNFTDKKEVTINYDYKCSKGELTSDKTKCSYTEKVPATINATCNKYQSCTTSREFNASTGKFEDKRTCVTKCNYSCPGGFDYNKSKRTCTGEITETKTIVSEKFISSYSCPTGYEKNGNYCTKTTTNITTDKKEATKNPTTYYCENSGHTLNGALCKYEVKNVLVKEAKVIESYSCKKDYTLNKTKCEKIVSTTDTKDVISETVCPSGYNLNNDKCTKNIIKYRYSERSCVGGSIDYKWSDSENDEALLKQGYVLTGVKEQRNSK